MEQQAIIEKITRCAEDNGWSVYVDAPAQSDRIDMSFQRYTLFDQDFNVTFSLRNDDTSAFLKEIRDYVYDFDADYEASLWIGEDGHGKNGAPYHIKDIVSDMEDTCSKVEDLLIALSQINFNEMQNEDINRN